MRRALRKYRVGSIIQLGILGYVAVALPYWTKVGQSTQSFSGVCMLLKEVEPALEGRPVRNPSLTSVPRCMEWQTLLCNAARAREKPLIAARSEWGAPCCSAVAKLCTVAIQMHGSCCTSSTDWENCSRQLLRGMQAFSFASPKALLNALLPKPQPAASSGSAQQAERVAAFRRFIEGVERRGGGERVPEFPAGAQWFNSPPLQLAR